MLGLAKAKHTPTAEGSNIKSIVRVSMNASLDEFFGAIEVIEKYQKLIDGPQVEYNREIHTMVTTAYDNRIPGKLQLIFDNETGDILSASIEDDEKGN